MADQMKARTQLLELAALLIPAIEVSFPNLWHNCIVYVVERYLQIVKLKCHTADQNFVIKSRFQHRALDYQGKIVYQLLESWSSQQYEQMPTNHVAKSQSCFNKDIYLQREILVNFQIFIVHTCVQTVGASLSRLRLNHRSSFYNEYFATVALLPSLFTAQRYEFPCSDSNVIISRCDSISSTDCEHTF